MGQSTYLGTRPLTISNHQPFKEQDPSRSYVGDHFIHHIMTLKKLHGPPITALKVHWIHPQMLVSRIQHQFHQVWIFALYNEQMLKMAKALETDVGTFDNQPKNKTLHHLCSETSITVAFHILEGLSDLMILILEWLSSVQVSPLKTGLHQTPTSVITADMQACCWLGQHVSLIDRAGCVALPLEDS